MSAARQWNRLLAWTAVFGVVCYGGFCIGYVMHRSHELPQAEEPMRTLLGSKQCQAQEESAAMANVASEMGSRPLQATPAVMHCVESFN